MSPRAFSYILLGLVLVLIITLNILHLPTWVSTVAPMLLTFIGLFLYITFLKRQQVQPATDPALSERAAASLARLGLQPVPIQVVTGGGRPVLQVKNGLVQISPRMGELLEDAELDAMMLMTFTHPA